MITREQIDKLYAEVNSLQIDDNCRELLEHKQTIIHELDCIKDMFDINESANINIKDMHDVEFGNCSIGNYYDDDSFVYLKETHYYNPFLKENFENVIVVYFTKLLDGYIFIKSKKFKQFVNMILKEYNITILDKGICDYSYIMSVEDGMKLHNRKNEIIDECIVFNHK